VDCPSAATTPLPDPGMPAGPAPEAYEKLDHRLGALALFETHAAELSIERGRAQIRRPNFRIAHLID